jgi:predicted transcriptional regulator of viral defense system
LTFKIKLLSLLLDMKVTDKIVAKINRIDTGDVFGYDTLGLTSDEIIAGSKALSRLVDKGVIKRARKGYYYKPKVSVFGEQKPREDVLLSLYLFEKNKQVAYITGTRLYNRLGLTTQVPSSIRVASLDRQVKGKVGNVVIKPAKSYVKVTTDTIKYLELLDVIKDLNTIPDLQKSDGLVYLKKTIYNFETIELKKLITYGVAYPPKVRALLGAILEAMNVDTANLSLLKKSINPSSSYDFGISPKMLSTVNSWNIV